MNSIAPPLVLIVDDEAAIRFTLRRTLESAGYAVLEAADGAEALAIIAIAAHRVAVVVSDVMMPGVDGFELLERLQRTHPEVPVVLGSGLHSRGALHAQSAHRLAGYLDKPYSHSIVLDVVAAAIARGTDA